MQRWRDRLARRFSATQVLRTVDRAEVLRAGGATQAWVVARSLCAYARFDCAAVPRRERASYLELAIRRWAPFPDAVHHVSWSGDQAMAWAWPASALVDQADADVRPDIVRCTPESIYLGQPAAEGAVLQECVEGIEGRVWRDGVLHASAWWPQQPSLPAWNRFLRGAGLPVQDAVPAPEAMPRQATPWVSHRGPSMGELGRRHGRRLAVAGVAAAVFLVAWQLGALLPLAWREFALQREMAQLEPSLGPIIDARESAERDMARVDSLLALRPPHSQTDLMANVAQAAPPGAVRITRWQYDAGDGLQVTLELRQPDPQALVAAYEASPLLDSVSVEPGDGPQRLRLRARIAPAEAMP